VKVEQLIIEENEPMPHAVDVLLLGVHVSLKGWDTDHHQEVSAHMGLNRKFTEWVEGSGSWGPLKLAFTVT
jgi:hypothetical protein